MSQLRTLLLRCLHDGFPQRFESCLPSHFFLQRLHTYTCVEPHEHRRFACPCTVLFLKNAEMQLGRNDGGTGTLGKRKKFEQAAIVELQCANYQTKAFRLKQLGRMRDSVSRGKWQGF